QDCAYKFLNSLRYFDPARRCKGGGPPGYSRGWVAKTTQSWLASMRSQKLRQSGRSSAGGSTGVGLRGRCLNCIAGLAALLAMIVAGKAPVHALESINVTTDAPAIDLTDAAERHRTDGDRILVSAAPGPDGIIRRMDVRARRQSQLGRVRAHQFRQRTDRAADRRAALPHGGLGRVLARSRPLARGQHHVERRAARAAG